MEKMRRLGLTTPTVGYEDRRVPWWPAATKFKTLILQINDLCISVKYP